MRLVRQIVMAFVGLTLFGGCKTKAPATKDEAKARIEAATQINNPSDRDQSLAEACRGAAKIGAVPEVLNAVNKIGNPSLRDQVEVDCALELRDCGQRAGAVEMAKLIGNPGTRDDALKKLASGS